MLPFFKVRPPLSTSQRVHIELLMRRTIDSIGPELPRRCQIAGDLLDLRLDLHNPTSLLESAKLAVTERFPGISVPVAVSVATNIDRDMPSAYHPASHDDPAAIKIHAATLSDPLRTSLELANQYAHHFWCTSGRVETDQIHPNLTHLLPICCGLVVLASTASFYDVAWSHGGWQGWSMSRAGYYNASEIGYAAALLARFRGEPTPDWMRLMRLDSRQTAKQATKFFAHCDRNQIARLFDATCIPGTESNPSELTRWLTGDDPAFALAAGYSLVKLNARSSAITAAAMEAADRKQGELIPIAIELLGRSQGASDEMRHKIEKFVGSSDSTISIAALRAADRLQMSMVPFHSKIERLLRDYAEGSADLAELIGSTGTKFESLGAVVCQHLGEAMLYSNDRATGAWMDCLKRICRDPRALIEAEVNDPENRAKLLAMLEHESSLGQ